MSITIAFRPSLEIETPTKYKVWRKANHDNPEESFLEGEFELMPGLEVNDPTQYFFTDGTGREEFWYRVQTCDGSLDAPLSPPLPGHGKSSFVTLLCGVSLLACFQPNAIPKDELWTAERDATWYILEEFLRPKMGLRDLLAQFRDPLPQVRLATESFAAMRLIGTHRAHDEDQFDKVKQIYSSTASSMGRKESMVTHSLDESENTQTNPGGLRLDWGRR